jgi:hypothetical protein
MKPMSEFDPNLLLLKEMAMMEAHQVMEARSDDFREGFMAGLEFACAYEAALLKKYSTSAWGRLKKQLEFPPDSWFDKH